MKKSSSPTSETQSQQKESSQKDTGDHNYFLYVIGHNELGELGLEHNKHVNELTHLDTSNKVINDICNGIKYSIYCNKETQQFWAAGSNRYGECALKLLTTKDNNDKKEVIEIKTTSKLESIKFFSENNIKIKNICINSSSYSTYFIAETGNIYMTGYDYYTRGSKQPRLAADIKGAIDIKTCIRHSIALFPCPPIDYIVSYLCRIINIDMPYDVINIMNIYYGTINVYSTGKTKYGGDGHGTEEYNKWTEIKAFENIKIVQVGVGFEHSLFLDSNGVVWGCGFNDCGELGIGHFETENSMVPQPIKYFIDNKIFIKALKCGHSYNLGLDSNNRIWSWGSNKYGQCGNGGDKTHHCNIPKMIECLKDKIIIDFACGASHCYAKTIDGVYWMWGGNEYNQCIGMEEDILIDPIAVNQIIYEKTGKKLIKAMFLGYDNTKIIMM